MTKYNEYIEGNVVRAVIGDFMSGVGGEKQDPVGNKVVCLRLCTRQWMDPMV